MSEQPQSTSLISIAAPKFLDNAISEPAKEVGKTLGNIFHVVFGPINYPIERYKVRQALNLKKYEDDLQTRLNNIPEENLLEPPLNIVGPALDASKFYIEEDELRGMFAKLISSSMDNRTSSFAHPSFVEIIKQLSILDAQNIKIIGEIGNAALVKYEIKTIKTNGSRPYLDNIFLDNKNCSDSKMIGPSISNLNRLGLINIDYSRQLKDKTIYDKFKQHQEYLSLNSALDPSHEIVSIIEGHLQISPLGMIFVHVCID